MQDVLSSIFIVPLIALVVYNQLFCDLTNPLIDRFSSAEKVTSAMKDDGNFR